MTAVRVATTLLASGTLLVVACLADAATSALMAPAVLDRLVPALLFNSGAALAAYLEGAIDTSGAVAGASLGTTIYVGGGWEAWTILVAMFVCAVAASNAGFERKQALGIAQERGGRRSGRHALANCGAAAAAAIAAVTSPYQGAAWLVLVTALAAAGADTAASEIGKARGGRTYLILGFRPVAPGTSGGISVAGSAANVSAAAALALLGAAVGLIGVAAVPMVTIASLTGSAAESLLGATLEPRGIVNNDLLNYINTVVAAAVVLAVTPI